MLSHESARIGDSRDHWQYGVVSHVNAAAAAAGVAPGQTTQEAARRLGD